MNDSNKYDARNIEILRSTPIVQVLADLGYNTSHAHGDLYFSPFHEEKHPSFHIDKSRNVWFDHGNPNPAVKEGGDVFALVMKLKHCSFPDAYKYLKELQPNIIIDTAPVTSISRTTEPKQSPIVVTNTYKGILSSTLNEYATNTRCIKKATLDRYCSQVHYHFRSSEARVKDGGRVRDMFAIGFPNIRKEWSLRNNMPTLPDGANHSKISTGAAYSIIGADGNFVYADTLKEENGGKSADTVVIFEGFFDFLSWMDWTGRETPNNCDIVVLNSTSNTKAAIEFIALHSKVIGYLDNDMTGNQHTEYIKSELEARNSPERVYCFTDARSCLNGCNDVNEAWIKICNIRKSRKTPGEADNPMDKEEHHQEGTRLR